MECDEHGASEACGRQRTRKAFPLDVSTLAGIVGNDVNGLEALADLVPPRENIALLTLEPLTPSDRFTVTLRRGLLHMVATERLAQGLAQASARGRIGASPRADEMRSSIPYGLC